MLVSDETVNSILKAWNQFYNYSMNWEESKWVNTWSFTSQDLFDNINFAQFGWTHAFYKLLKTDRWKKLVGMVFTYFMYLVILDIIENNVTFELPLKGTAQAEFYVKSFTGEAFRRLYQAGKWDDVDFLNCDFTGYQIYFRYKTKRGDWKEKPVYLSHKNARDIFHQKINEGKKYY